MRDICYANCYAKCMICKNCLNEFNAQRSTALFCSVKCRVYYNRQKAPGLVSARDAAKLVDSSPGEIARLVDPVKSFDFCKHNQVKGFCKKGCR